MNTKGSIRWRICALLFFATTINYVDRQVLGILAPQLQAEFKWSDSQYGLIVTTFQVAYAIGFLFIGNFIDKIGTRLGYTLSIVFWSIAAILHAASRSAIGFAVARFGLGLGEAGNFPSAVKAVAEWFPKKERALATGIFVSGSSVGAMFAPMVVPVIAIHYGWQSAFIATGLLGFVWLFFWLTTYSAPEKHPRMTQAELAHIKTDAPLPDIKTPWLTLLRHRQTWAFTLGKFLTDPVFSFFFFFCRNSFIRTTA